MARERRVEAGGQAGGDAEGRVLARLEASAPRRWMAVGMLMALAALLGWIALDTPPASLSLRLILVIVAVGAIVLARRVWQATSRAVVLTESGLYDDHGRQIAAIEEIVAVERGAFAFKPSNGFLVRLAHPHPDGAAWQPGLWWRIGRRVGVGGVTPGAAGRFMAELIAERLARRGRAAAR
ncbi:MAG: hypothetical protein D6811_05335 [Alphaproteobacteria bacterium]|nr:MAG: hypothetical protein D6811_05335 [Alphaproteobacteria bacterium]